MNEQLINGLVQIINSLSVEEKNLLAETLFFSEKEPTTKELMRLAEQSNSIDFLKDEPDLYGPNDGEEV